MTASLANGKFENCWKCNGTGVIPAFRHVANGCCFACDGTGRVKAAKECEKDGVYTFVVDGMVWQFQPIHHYDLDEDTAMEAHIRATKGQRVDTVMLHAFERGANRRTGTTILRARVSPEIGRKVWKDAKKGMKPEQMTDEYLEASGCARTRNFRGVEVW